MIQHHCTRYPRPRLDHHTRYCLWLCSAPKHHARWAGAVQHLQDMGFQVADIKWHEETGHIAFRSVDDEERRRRGDNEQEHVDFAVFGNVELFDHKFGSVEVVSFH